MNTTYTPNVTSFALNENKTQYLELLYKQKKKEMHIRCTIMNLIYFVELSTIQPYFKS